MGQPLLKEKFTAAALTACVLFAGGAGGGLVFTVGKIFEMGDQLTLARNRIEVAEKKINLMAQKMEEQASKSSGPLALNAQ
ncbi:MAG: hypothetical protein H6862_01075 [Rhodospirillales bacterium]|nr:hypothetical protein [Rhodospirillales bacterium]